MEIVKTEDIKEVSDIVSSSAIKVSCGIECVEQMTLRSVIPVNEVGLECIKCETNDEEDSTMSYDIHMSTNIDIKGEIDVEEHELNYKQPKSIKTEGYQIVYHNDHMEHISFDLLGRSNSEHGPYISDMESIKGEESVEKEDSTSGGTDVDMEKQNVANQSEDNYSEYETRDVGKRKVKIGDSFGRYGKREKDIEQHQSILAHKTEDKPALQTIIKETYKRNGKCFKCLSCDYSTICRQSLNGEFYHCFNCKYKTKVEKDFIVHLKMQHNKTAKWHQCHLCDFKTKLKSNLTHHYRCMHQEDPAEIFHCELCSYKTKYKNHLLRHHRWKHGSSEIFHCELCGFETKYKNNLLTHHTLKHNNTAEIIHCGLCNYKTKVRQNLLKHNRSHHDDSAQIFQCELCNFKTKYRSSFSVHHRIKHNNSAETFHCFLCSFKTKYRSTFLRHHRLKHDDSTKFFHCKKCDFKSKNKCNLSRHHKQKH